jgi:hypothetical protein
MGTFIIFFAGLWFYFSSFLVEIKRIGFLFFTLRAGSVNSTSL